MSKTPQHEFPEDWRKISNEEAISHIKYLLEHYEEYDIEKYGNGNTLTINGIIIAPMNIYDCKMFIVAQKVYGGHLDLDIYPLIQQLFDVCAKEVKKREQKAETKAKNAYRKGTIINVIGCCFTVIVLVAGTYAFVKLVNMGKQERAKQIKIENEVKRYEKTLPNYKEYEQVKVQIQNYRDSLENTGR